jgi:hypothetical protein
VNPSYPFDPELHEPGSTAAHGVCSYHAESAAGEGSCSGQPVVSYRDSEDRWQSGCSTALERLVDNGDIAPLGQGA